MSNCLTKCLSLLVLLGLTSVTNAQEKTLLRYKFTPGQKLKYIAKNDVDAKVVTASLTTKIKVNYQFEVTLDVLTKDVRGNATIKATIDELRFVVKADTNAVSFEIGYDTKKKQWLGDPNPIEDMKKYVSQVVELRGRDFTFKVGTRGQLKELALSKELNQSLETLHEDLEVKDIQAEMQQLLGSVFLLVPADEVKKGNEWTSEQETKTEHRTITYTYTGPADKGHKSLETVAFVVKRKIINPPAKFKTLKLEKQQFKGTIIFDTTSGFPAEVSAVLEETTLDEPKHGLKATTTGTSHYSLKINK